MTTSGSVASTHPHRPQGLVLASWALGVLILGQFAFLLVYRRINLDEGWYLWAARLVYEGQILYRDFAYTQTPVLPYVYGLVQQVAPGLFNGRLLTIALALLAWGLAANLARLRHGLLAGFMSLLLLASAPFVATLFSYTATYGLAALLLVLAFVAADRIPSELPRSALVGVLLALAVGVRLSTAVAVPILLLYLLLTSKDPLITALWCAAGGLLTALIVFLPFVLLDYTAFRYDVFSFHTDRILRPDWRFGKMVRVAWRTGIDFLVPNLLAYLGLLVLFVRGVGQKRFRYFWRRWGLELAAAAVVLGLYAAHLLPRTTDSYYNGLQYPLLVLAAGPVVAGVITRLRVVAQPGARATVAAVLLATLVVAGNLLLQGLAVARDGTLTLPLQNQFKPLAEAAAYIQQTTEPEDSLLTFNTHLALESGRAVPNGYEMSIFAYRPTWTTEQARRFRVVNNELLLQSLVDGAAAVALTDFDRQMIYGERDAVFGALAAGYRWQKTVPDFDAYGGDLRIYLPPGAPQPGPQHPLSAESSVGIHLLGYDLIQRQAGAVPGLTLALYWQADRAIPADYTGFAQVLDRSGALLVGWDNPPCHRTCPTTGWLPGEVLRDEYLLSLEGIGAEQMGRVQVGLYDSQTGQRLLFTVAEENPQGAIVLPGQW